MAERLRAFVAIELPDGLRSALAALRGRLALPPASIRWVPADNLHLTLKFLGDLPVDNVDAVAAELARVGRRHPPLRLQAGGLGVFPGARKPRVLWAGVGGQKKALQILQQDIESALEPLGWKREKRPFRGHLTLARFKKAVGARQLGRVLADGGGFGPTAFGVTRVHLMRSTLHPTGAVYSRLATADLTGPPPTAGG
jgi:2'-5' RNA ligase